MKRFKADFSAIHIVVTALLTAAYISICHISFGLTGAIVFPLAISFISTFLITCGVLFIKKDSSYVTSVGIAQLLTVLFWICFALIGELKINASAGWVPYWIEYFYFDKFLMLGTVWLSGTLVITLGRLVSKEKADNHKSFFKISSISFCAFYFALLFYSFVLIRLETGEYPLNLIPFTTIREYIDDWQTIPYEVFMMFFGNLLYFTPMGYIFYVKLRHKSSAFRAVIIAVFPLAAFSLLELSQYLLQNGFCEIDDMLMNSVGFWFGAVLAPLSDRLTRKITDNRINHFWC